MDDAGLVSCVQCRADLFHQVDRDLSVRRFLLLQILPQVGALDVLLRDVLNVFLFADRKDLHDVGMIESR